MKKTVRNLSILILPFLILIGVNEAVRPTIKEPPFSFHGIAAINPSGKKKDTCTWFCHNQTDYCKIHHVKLLGDHCSESQVLEYQKKIPGLSMSIDKARLQPYFFIRSHKNISQKTKLSEQ
jgi:hypothetical protein